MTRVAKMAHNVITAPSSSRLIRMDECEQCINCRGWVLPLGYLGPTLWGRCRNCGFLQILIQESGVPEPELADSSPRSQPTCSTTDLEEV